MCIKIFLFPCFKHKASCLLLFSSKPLTEVGPSHSSFSVPHRKLQYFCSSNCGVCCLGRASCTTLPDAVPGIWQQKGIPRVYEYKHLSGLHVLFNQRRKYFVWHQFYLFPFSICGKENCNGRNGLNGGNRAQGHYAAVTPTFTYTSKLRISLSIHSIAWKNNEGSPYLLLTCVILK